MSEDSSSIAAVPFTHLARQRKQEEREVSLTALVHQIVNDTSAACDARLEALMSDYQLMAQLNAAAGADVGTCMDVSVALSQFAADLEARQAVLHDALSGALPALDAKLHSLETLLVQLDHQSRALEAQLMAEAAAAAVPGASCAASRSGPGSSYYMSSLYETLQQQLPRMGSAGGPKA